MMWYMRAINEIDMAAMQGYIHLIVACWNEVLLYATSGVEKKKCR